MLDLRKLANEPDAVIAALSRRKVDEATLDAVRRIASLAGRRSAIVTERDTLRADRNRISKEIGALYKAGRGDDAEAAKGEVARINDTVKALEAELAGAEAEQQRLAMTLPNLLDDAVPDGASEAENVVLREVGQRPSFDFTPQAHVEVGEALGMVDMGRASKLAGARFGLLRGAGARLERALATFFLDLHTQEHGYTELALPFIVHRQMLEGTGQLPKFEEDAFRLAGELNGADAFLIPTGEVPATNLHRDEILDASQLPMRLVCDTPCFRSEAGSAGRDVRGLLRVHQFRKIEIVQLTTPEASAQAHEAMLAQAERCLQLLGLPYRVVLLCGADTGFGAARCYDLEVWLPSQQAYREVSSISNFHDFQARRMNLRYRPEDGGKPRFCHTLNGSGLAVGRTLVAILENYQQADGSLRVPDVLQGLMGTDRIASATA